MPNRFGFNALAQAKRLKQYGVKGAVEIDIDIEDQEVRITTKAAVLDAIFLDEFCKNHNLLYVGRNELDKVYLHFFQYKSDKPEEKVRQIGELQDYLLVQDDIEVSSISDNHGVNLANKDGVREYSYLYVKTGNADLLEIWGANSAFLGAYAYKLYNEKGVIPQ
nr:hypothetical protein [uncultured Nitrososphaera sp.]